MTGHQNGSTPTPPPPTDHDRLIAKIAAELQQASQVRRPVTIVIVVNGNQCSFDVARPAGLYKVG